MANTSNTEAHRAAENAARQSYGKLVAFLAARNRDVASAEDALAEAFAAALAQWPVTGTPNNPEAWLLTAARRKLIDAARRRKTGAAAEPHLSLLTDELAAAAEDAMSIPDRRLALMFACAHPAIDEAIRAPLILQTILGLDAAAIGSAFLVSPASMGQRLVRAKTKIKQAGIAFKMPEAEELADRLEPVLDAVYAAFSEGWTDADGTESKRRNLAEEAIWLGQLLVTLLPDEPEVLGLLSLMLHAEARRPARRDVHGDYVPLSEQDPAAWTLPLVQQAEALLHGASTKRRLGRYQLQAAVQSVHAARRITGKIDWVAIDGLYEALHLLTGSPVVAINRAVAIGEVHGSEAGLSALPSPETATLLLQYQPYWAARARLLSAVGQPHEAIEAYDIAIGLEPDPAVRRFLQRKRQALRH